MNVLAVVLLCAVYALEPRQDLQGKRVSDGQWTVSVEESRERDPETGDLSVFVRIERDHTAVRTAVVTGRFAQVKDLIITPGGILVVAGVLKYGGDILGIVNLETAEPMTTIWAYGFSISPDGQKLVYQSHFPRLGSLERRESIVMLYPLDREVAGANWSANHTPGVPIFPQVVAEIGVVDPEQEPGHLVTSPFLWRVDSAGVVFGDYYGDRNWLVSINIVPNKPRPFTQSTRVRQPEYLEPPGRALVFESVRWTREGWILGQLAFPDSSPLQREFVVMLAPALEVR